MGMRVGLDFGTSNSGVAISNGKQVNLLPIDQHSILPEVIKTILYITRNQQAFIGQGAVDLYYKQNVNRLRRYVMKWAGEIEYRGSDMHYVRDVFVSEDELKPGRLLQYLKTTLGKAAGPDAYLGTQVFERYYRVVDLIHAYLAELKKRAEAVLGDEIVSVTIGRPVKFSLSSDLDQQAEETLRQAANLAGFQEVNFELEPVAAALYYEKTIDRVKNTLVFDFGGGTLDIAIMRLGDPHQRKVYASGGISIAGRDFDQAIIQKRLLSHFGEGQVSHEPLILDLIQSVPDWAALPELSTPLIRQHLENAVRRGIAPVQLKNLQALIFNDLAYSFYSLVEAAKIALSSKGATVIQIQGEDIDIWEMYTRTQFEEDIQEYIIQIEKVLLETVALSGLEVEEIDAVVTTGGSSNIPIFSAMLERIFNPECVIKSNTFSSVVAGLAIRAAEIG